MSKEIYISSTPHETRLAIVENDALTEIYYERENEYTLAGSIYNGRVTRVLPGMQSSFVDIGLERDAFLYITDFMEEAGDSAEFESTHGGGAELAGRPDSERSEPGHSDGRRDRTRGDRTQRAPETIERPSVLTSVPPADSPDVEQGGQEDRNGRSGRGRRGRRDGRPDRERSGRLASERPGLDRAGLDSTIGVTRPRWDEGQPDFSGRSAPVSSEGDESVDDASGDVAGMGEGAPGADGSRRWRGRRGRRRGRGLSPAGSGQEEDSGVVNVEGAASDRTSMDTLPEDGSEKKSFEPQASVAPGSPSREQDVETHVQGGQAPRSVAEGAAAGPGRRGRSDSVGQRGRDRGAGGRDARRGSDSRQNDRTQRIPRGFEPRKNLYGVDNNPSQAEASDISEKREATPERIILPGESLSKYRQGGEERPSAVKSGAPGVIQPEVFKLAVGWDGGAILPGESLSRHRGGEVGRNVGGEPIEESQSRRAGREDRHSRDDRGNVNGRGEPASGDHSKHDARAERRSGADLRPMVRDQIHPVAAAVQSAKAEELKSKITMPDRQHVPVIKPVSEARSSHSGRAPESITPYEASWADKNKTLEEQPEAPLPSISASENGQSEEAPKAGTEHEHEPSAASASHRFDPAPPSEYRQSPVTREDTDRGALATEEGPAPLAEKAQSRSTDSTDHATTTIEASGNMHSERTTGVPPPPIPNDDSAEPTEPILHETAVVEQRGQEAGTEFAPGTGDLEEELIEDEDTDTTTLAAGADEGYDDLEEETLEGGADLGTMLREMTIDQMVRPEVRAENEEDGDAFEEDFEEAAEKEGSAPGLAEEQDREELHEQHEVSQQTSEGENGALPLTGDQAPRRDRRDGDGRERDGRRGGRDAGRRGDRRGSDRDRGSDRARRTGGSGDRGPGRGRAMQSINLPAISDLLKPGQEILVQIAKEPIAKKGARITSHIALPGRFLVFMPTVSHTGVSRKIESDGERQRLKRILLSEKGEAAGGFIVRTAAAGASEEELRSDLRFLLNLWMDIKQRSESSKSPALIYHDLNLVERVLRDQVTDTFSAIWVDTEGDYERILKFLQRFQPSLIRRVKLYSKETPLFEQFGITEEINKALRSKVWLKSGGSIVINQTEALVAIDINTGKFVGKTARLEDTIVKTNLDAIPEIVRQIRLRDLGGIIILDFIDMDERKNRNRVMAALEEELKTDRAPSKVLQFNDFGLVAITRKRVKQSLERTLSTTCTVCVGTGMVKSPITVCNDIYIEMRKMHKHLDRGDVMLRVHPEVVKQLKVAGGRWLQEMEEMAGKTILVKSDPSLHPEQFDIH